MFVVVQSPLAVFIQFSW